MPKHWLRLAYCTFSLMLFACSLPVITPTPEEPPPVVTRVVPTLFPTIAQLPPTAAPTTDTTQPSDTGWQAGSHGVEVRHFRLPSPLGQQTFPLTVVRFDLARVRLRVAYTPEQPLLMRSWMQQRQPLAAINGSFFSETNAATALVISDGRASGASYEGFGGMLAVDEAGNVQLWALSQRAYDPNEQFSQALQSFPMLVFPGGERAPFQDNGDRARRSAVALDRQGRLLLIVSPTSTLTLTELGDWLRQSDMEIERALNLDGGPSTGLFVDAGAQNVQIDSFDAVPIVLLIEANGR